MYNKHLSYLTLFIEHQAHFPGFDSISTPRPIHYYYSTTACNLFLNSRGQVLQPCLRVRFLLVLCSFAVCINRTLKGGKVTSCGRIIWENYLRRIQYTLYATITYKLCVFCYYKTLSAVEKGSFFHILKEISDSQSFILKAWTGSILCFPVSVTACTCKRRR